MSAHLHGTFVEGCYRCDLGRDEAYIPPHVCDTGTQDRILCPEPCGVGHVYCSVCDEIQDHCVLDDATTPTPPPPVGGPREDEA